MPGSFTSPSDLPSSRRPSTCGNDVLTIAGDNEPAAEDAAPSSVAFAGRDDFGQVLAARLS